jgi:hypothetical protein
MKHKTILFDLLTDIPDMMIDDSIVHTELVKFQAHLSGFQNFLGKYYEIKYNLHKPSDYIYSAICVDMFGDGRINQRELSKADSAPARLMTAPRSVPMEVRATSPPQVPPEIEMPDALKPVGSFKREPISDILEPPQTPKRRRRGGNKKKGQKKSDGGSGGGMCNIM